MPKRVTLQPAGKQFPVEQHETILEAGLGHGLNLPYSCANGTCGDCRSQLVMGGIEQIRNHDFNFSEKEKSDNWFLTCSCRPVTDIEIRLNLSELSSDIPQQCIEGRISKTVLLNDDILQLLIRTPRSRTLRFLAGQKVQLTFGNCVSILLPLASCPCDGMHLRFHLHTDELATTECWQELLRHGQRVTIQGPCGDFVMNESSTRPLLFLAWDTGFAQIGSLIDHAITIDPDRRMVLYWLSPSQDGHYLSNYCRSWEDALDNFSYRPVALKSIQQMDAVISQILETHTLSKYDTYMTLPYDRMKTTSQLILDQGLPPEQLFIDSV